MQTDRRTDGRTGARTDRHDEANSPFSKFCELAQSESRPWIISLVNCIQRGQIRTQWRTVTTGVWGDQGAGKWCDRPEQQGPSGRKIDTFKCKNI
jgi:hypothetical protein